MEERGPRGHIALSAQPLSASERRDETKRMIGGTVVEEQRLIHERQGLAQIITEREMREAIRTANIFPRIPGLSLVVRGTGLALLVVVSDDVVDLGDRGESRVPRALVCPVSAVVPLLPFSALSRRAAS